VAKAVIVQVISVIPGDRQGLLAFGSGYRPKALLLGFGRGVCGLGAVYSFLLLLLLEEI